MLSPASSSPQAGTTATDAGTPSLLNTSACPPPTRLKTSSVVGSFTPLAGGEPGLAPSGGATSDLGRGLGWRTRRQGRRLLGDFKVRKLPHALCLFAVFGVHSDLAAAFGGWPLKVIASLPLRLIVACLPRITTVRRFHSPMPFFRSGQARMETGTSQRSLFFTRRPTGYFPSAVTMENVVVVISVGPEDKPCGLLLVRDAGSHPHLDRTGHILKNVRLLTNVTQLIELWLERELAVRDAKFRLPPPIRDRPS